MYCQPYYYSSKVALFLDTSSVLGVLKDVIASSDIVKVPFGL